VKRMVRRADSWKIHECQKAAGEHRRLGRPLLSSESTYGTSPMADVSSAGMVLSAEARELMSSSNSLMIW
jgi:hypothetical protein